MGTFGLLEYIQRTGYGQRALENYPGILEATPKVYDTVATVFNRKGYAIGCPPSQRELAKGESGSYWFLLCITGKTEEGLRWLTDYFRGDVHRFQMPPVPKNPNTGEDIYAVWITTRIHAGLLADELLDYAKSPRDRHVFRSLVRATRPQSNGTGITVPESVVKIRESTVKDINIIFSDWPIEQTPGLKNKEQVLSDLELLKQPS